MLSLEKLENLVKEKIENLEELNQHSRQFCRLLDKENKEDKEIDEQEFTMRTRREYAIMQFETLLEEIKEIGDVK